MPITTHIICDFCGHEDAANGLFYNLKLQIQSVNIGGYSYCHNIGDMSVISCRKCLQDRQIYFQKNTSDKIEKPVHEQVTTVIEKLFELSGKPLQFDGE